MSSSKSGPKKGQDSRLPPSCRVLLVEEAAALQRQSHGQAVRVTGRITALGSDFRDLTICGWSRTEGGRGPGGANKAEIEEGQALCPGGSNTAAVQKTLRVRLDAVSSLCLTVGALCQFGGELEWEEDSQQLILVARFGRRMDGLDKRNFLEVLEEAREFWEKQGFHSTPT